MTKLNQIVAIEKGVKSRSYAELTDAHHALLKPDLLSGLSRTYQPKDDDGETQPSENKLVQVRANQMLEETAQILTRLFDVTATKDYANCEARADVVIDGKPLLKSVPITYLLFLEKQLTDVATFIRKLPVLDPSETWTFDSASNSFVTQPVTTNRTKKIPRNHVKAEATDKHPAQVELYHEDVVVGYWKTIRFSGALPQVRVNVLIERVEILQEAVKFAREEANSLTITDEPSVGDAVFGYLFEA